MCWSLSYFGKIKFWKYMFGMWIHGLFINLWRSHILWWALLSYMLLGVEFLSVTMLILCGVGRIQHTLFFLDLLSTIFWLIHYIFFLLTILFCLVCGLWLLRGFGMGFGGTVGPLAYHQDCITEVQVHVFLLCPLLVVFENQLWMTALAVLHEEFWEFLWLL